MVVSFWFREVLNIILIILPFVREESEFLQVEFHTHGETMYRIRVCHWHAFYESEISALIIWPKVVRLITSTSVTLSGLIMLTSPFPLAQLPHLFSFLFSCGHVRIMERTKIWVILNECLKISTRKYCNKKKSTKALLRLQYQLSPSSWEVRSNIYKPMSLFEFSFSYAYDFFTQRSLIMKVTLYKK